MCVEKSSILQVGLFGGTFDPPHVAHQALAEVALTQLHLDRLVLMPTGSAWYKTRALSDGAHRLAMCRLAFEGCEKVAVDDLEIQRDGPCYTIDTLRHLQKSFPRAVLHLIIGADQAAKFNTWYRWQEILSMACLAVADRQQQACAALNSQGVENFTVLQMPDMLVSATAIRMQIAQGIDPYQLSPKFLAPAVARYIQDHGLYRVQAT
jgi:nicotinate-nucleotide adenylyltransferase